MSLDVYSHVMPPAEVPAERFLSLLPAHGRAKVRDCERPATRWDGSLGR
jgi:hypothetical protein